MMLPSSHRGQRALLQQQQQPQPQEAEFSVADVQAIEADEASALLSKQEKSRRRREYVERQTEQARTATINRLLNKTSRKKEFTKQVDVDSFSSSLAHTYEYRCC